ncbi:MAG: LacI family DNA-binding transcriptional regulator [Anaerolineaceae bacterium]|nr:LacI family DNA-binding transcriptional regulator [Anaerolineaceae bacterium]
MRDPTIIDVAKLAGVSKATAARVLNGQEDIVRETTRQRVLVAAEQLGYVRNAIAGSLRTNQTYVVALSIPDITNPFWPEVARGVQDTMETGGYTTVIVNSDWKRDRESRFLTLVRRSRFDGLIINVVETSADDLTNLRIPVVILGRDENYPAHDSVGSNTAGGSDAALQYLFELGHRRIGLISGMSHRYSTRVERYKAFLSQYQLPFDPALMMESDFTDEAGYHAMQRLLDQPHPPTAVLAANDTIAIGALKAAQAMSWRVPQDISIIGMDDIYAAATTSPGLTTVAKPKYDIGMVAAQILMERMSGEAQDEPQRVKLPCELIVRGSTAPPGQRD